MMKRIKVYQRVIVSCLCVAILTLVMSLVSVCLHYFYLNATYKSIVVEEQNKILEEVQNLTIKDAIEKGYGAQIKLLMQPREPNIAPISKIQQIQKLEATAWITAITAIVVILLLLFVYWYIRKKIIRSLKRDLDGILLQVRSVVSSVDLKDQKTLIDLIPFVVEIAGYKSIAVWIRQALTPIESKDNSL